MNLLELWLWLISRIERDAGGQPKDKNTATISAMWRGVVAPTGIVAFICAQFAGMAAAVLLARWFWPSATKSNINSERSTVF